MRRTVAWLASVGVAIAGVASAEPFELPVQGRLSNLAGPAPDGSYGMAVRLYPGDTGGPALFTETHLAVPVRGGVFDLTLGTVDPVTNPLDTTLFAALGARWLGVTVGGDPELERVPLRDVPYAVWARRATRADDLACSGCVGAADLAPGAVGRDALAPELATLAATDAANAWTALQRFEGGVDFAQIAAKRFRFEAAAAPPVVCAPDSAGSVYYDTVKGDVLVCTGAAWRSLVNVALLGSIENPATSCRAILTAGFSVGSGVYYLRTAWSPDAFKVFCDMETHGGGWTRVANVRADQHLCSYVNGLGTETELLTDTGSTGIMPSAQASTIPMTERQVMAYISPSINDVFTSSAAGFTWANIANGTLNSWNIQNFAVTASRNGGAFQPLGGPALCGNGPCMLGGYFNSNASTWTIIIGIGSHDNGTFTQNGSCTSATTPYKGMYTGIPNHLWGQKGAVYIR